MKNKEIEEILNYMKQYVKNKYEHDSEPMLNWKDLQIVLSYIEQLQTNVNKCKQLENNRDKAIEYVKEFRFATVKFEQHSDTLLNILKGDSDNE